MGVIIYIHKRTYSYVHSIIIKYCIYKEQVVITARRSRGWLEHTWHISRSPSPFPLKPKTGTNYLREWLIPYEKINQF